MVGNNGENVEPVIVDIGLCLEEGIDQKKATEYIEKLFRIWDRFGDLLHNEKLTVGETLFVIYILEKGALSTMNVNDPEDISYLLLDDNKLKMDMIVNMIIKNEIEKSEKEKGEQKNWRSEITKYWLTIREVG